LRSVFGSQALSQVDGYLRRMPHPEGVREAVSDTAGAAQMIADNGWRSAKSKLYLENYYIIFIYMSSPKRTKFRKHQKGSIGGIKSNVTKLGFGQYGLKALQEGRISARTIEAVRRVSRRLTGP